jgi:hypothetical protein
MNVVRDLCEVENSIHNQVLYKRGRVGKFGHDDCYSYQSVKDNTRIMEHEPCFRCVSEGSWAVWAHYVAIWQGCANDGVDA